MRKQPKVSIIVVSLNTKNFFLKTIISIINQSFKSKEIIVVDGQSSDGTLLIIKKFKKIISKIIIEKDKGIYDAMNKGVQLASGKWIIFMNSGDIFFNKKVLSNIFEYSFLQKDIDILFGDTIVKHNSLDYLSKSKEFNDKTIVMPFCHQSSIVKTSLIKKYKFQLKYKFSSDFNFFLKCFKNKFFFSN